MQKMAKPGPPSSMEDMWREAAARFNSRTRKDIDIKPPRTFDDCVKSMERNQASAEREEKPSTEKGKQYGIAILKCIKLLGGVATTGAEMVFGSPASLCFNALSLLLDIPEKLRDFRMQIDDLFGVIEPALSVFKIYDTMEQFDELEEGLKEAINKVMISVVDICALSIELTNPGKWKNFKNKFKVSILEENSIKEEIDQLQRLTGEHHSIQSTQTLKVVLETKDELVNYLNKETEQSQQISANIAILMASDNKRNVEGVARNHLNNIKEKLGIAASYKSVKDMGDFSSKGRIPNTACWFTDVPEFSTWADHCNATVSPLLVITGAPNTGKSVILSSMVQHLRYRHEGTTKQSPRALIAAYFFRNITDKSIQEAQPITTALKSIACQLAEQDLVYAKTLSQACDKKSKEINFFTDAGCQELWEFLCIGLPRGQNLHYLAFDGLAALPDESNHEKQQKLILLKLLRDTVGSRVRILVSARPETFQDYTGLPPGNIVVENHTVSDIKRFIEHDLKARDLFQDTDDEEFKDQIVVTLSQYVHGNFNKIRAALDKIRDAVAADASEEEIKRIVEATKMDEKQIFEATITQLEHKLTKGDIDELNELLIWVICGKVWFTVEMLTALLLLRFERKGTLKLKKKLLGKYSGIFGIRKEGGVCVLDEMDEMLITKRTKPREQDETPTYSVAVTVTRGDIRSVQSFLWSLSQKVDSVSRDIYGFEEVANRDGAKGKIQVNKVDGHLAILRRTFSILSKSPCDESRLLGRYLISFLPDHLAELQKAEDHDQLTEKQKQEIGEGIFSLFASGEYVERHWDSCEDVEWHRNPNDLNIFRQWLDNPIVARPLGKLDRQWLSEVRSDANPNQALLAKIMKTVARRWLCDREWSAVRACKWLQEYMKLPAAGAPDEQDGDQQKTMDVSFNDVYRWGKNLLGTLTTEETVLSFERLGEALAGTNNPRLAIGAYNKAISAKEPSTWTSHQGLAKALAQDLQYEEACLEMQKALQLLEKEEDPKKNTFLSAGFLFHADYYLKLEQPQESIGCVKRALELAPDNHHAYYKLLGIYLINDSWEDAGSLVESILRQGESESNGDLIRQVLEDMAADDDAARLFGGCLKALLSDSESLELMLQAMGRASEKARKEDRRDDLIFFLLYEGIFHYHRKDMDESRIQSAMNCWEKCMEVDVGYSNWHQRRMLAYGWACGHHFDHARALTMVEDEQAELHIRKVQDIAEKESSPHITMSKAYLGAYYGNVRGQSVKAHSLLKPSFESAMQLLFDDDVGNDWQGYYHMAMVLMHCGDTLNAMSTCALLFPDPQETNVLSWILEFDERPIKELVSGLVEAARANSTPSDLEAQIDYLLERIEGVLSSPPEPESDGSDGAAELGNSDSTNTKQKSSFDLQAKDQIDEDSNATITDTSSVSLTEKEIRQAYEQIKYRLHEWQPRSLYGTFKFTCDGRCGRIWDFDEAINLCTYCFDTGFCDGCLAKVKAGDSMLPSIERRCNKNHEWLHLPKWNREEYLQSLKKEVRVGGELDSQGYRVGGNRITQAEWLTVLKVEWGILT